MVDKVNKIKSIPFDELKGSPDVMLLLSVYSSLFLKGSQPGSCERCMRQYYYDVVTKGVEMAINYEKMKTRTLIPNWDGIKYIRGAFYDSSMINDEQAIDGLKNGFLSETHFKKLPEGYNQPESVEEIVTEEKPKIKGRKPKK